MSAVLVLFLRGLFALALFVFLGTIMFVLWKDLQHTIKRSTNYSITPITLTIRSDQVSRTFNQPEFYIGRDAQADMLIQNETLSAIHARVFFKNQRWMIEDLQSTNGTFINEERLSTPAVLVNEDLVSCGQVVIQVTIPAD